MSRFDKITQDLGMYDEGHEHWDQFCFICEEPIEKCSCDETDLAREEHDDESR